MAETDPITPPATDPVTPPAAPSAPAGEQHVPYSRFKEVNDKYTALKAQTEQQTAAQQTLEQRLAAIEGDLKTERHTNQRLQVASAKKLPSELADRLRGETPEELEADADRLLAWFKPAAGPGVPPVGGGGGAKPALDISKMTAAQVRQARAEGKI